MNRCTQNVNESGKSLCTRGIRGALANEIMLQVVVPPGVVSRRCVTLIQGGMMNSATACQSMKAALFHEALLQDVGDRSIHVLGRCKTNMTRKNMVPLVLFCANHCMSAALFHTRWC